MANSYFIDGTLALVIVASLCFYAAGLLMNDLADEAEDRRDRPNRPLPSGAASRKSVSVVMVALCVTGLGVLALSGNPRAVAAGGALIVAITCYNFVTKHWPVVGALNMGLCRGLSVALGGFVRPIATTELTTIPVIAIGLYIAAVTNLARHENARAGAGRTAAASSTGDAADRGAALVTISMVRRPSRRSSSSGSCRPDDSLAVREAVSAEALASLDRRAYPHASPAPGGDLLHRFAAGGTVCGRAMERRADERDSLALRVALEQGRLAALLRELISHPGFVP